MPEMMHAADVIVTKGGVSTIAEALASGRPVVVAKELPVQEAGNPRFVEAHGIGFDGRSPRGTLEALRRLAANPAERQAMAARARPLARPNAADAIARMILGLGASTAAGQTIR